MLHRLIARNDDLRWLANEGYQLSLSRSQNHLLLSHVPYVSSHREVKYGTLVTALNTAGELVNAPADHVVYFIGEMPCTSAGVEIDGIRNSQGPLQLDADLRSDRTFSARPASPYRNYYDKLTTYVAMIAAHAKIICPEVTATPFLPIQLSESDSVFRYADTASSRAGISALTAKLEGQRVAIVGLGGTGSYVLDLVAKTPVAEIHLFDADTFSSHNAFRCPGAAAMDELEARPTKVAFFAAKYLPMRRGILAHDHMLGAENAHELLAMTFVFLCMDGGDEKLAIARTLQQSGIPFIDAGLGIQVIDDRLMGVVRTTTSSGTKSDHVLTSPLLGGGGDNDYDRNIQVAELNAMNAVLAVVKWKKLLGFYADETREHSTNYSVSRNVLINEQIG